MLKTLGNKLVSEQSRNWNKQENELNSFPREVQDHLSLNMVSRRKKSEACNRPAVQTALIV